MSWHFQLMRHPDGTLAVHEMYPLDHGSSWTENPVDVVGDSPEDVKRSLRQMLADIERHGVVDYPEDKEPMTKNFVEVGETYKSEQGNVWKCIGIDDGVAWCYMLPNCSAHRFRLNGSGVDLTKTKLLPPGPRIVKNDANLYSFEDNAWRVWDYHDPNDTNGTLYTHEDAKVAIFVPDGIGSLFLSDAIAQLNEEIG